jgi:hypothetical protein
MDAFLHTFIAIACMLGAYMLGQRLCHNDIISRGVIDDIVEHTLKMLEEDGYILTEEKGEEVELILISEIVAKALKEKNG